MCASWRACRSTIQCRPLHKRATSIRRPPRTVVDNRPITKVKSIVIKATSKHPALQEGTADSFSRLRLRGDVVDALKNIGITKPTVIQRLSIPHILRGRNVLCAAETGSGKTLAYLAPLISELKRVEEEEGVVSLLRRPRALILLPSRDLASQVLAVAKSLCHVARFRAVGLIRSGTKRNIRSSLLNPVDLAVTTPDALFKFRRDEKVQFKDVRFLVVDEADTMFDQSFIDTTTKIIEAVNGSAMRLAPVLDGDDVGQPLRRGVQLTAVAATLSTHLMKNLEKLVPSMKVVTTKNLHRILPHIEQQFYKLTQPEKSEKLLSIIRDHPRDVFMVFCNTIPSCDWTSHFLQANGVPTTKLHAGFRASSRKDLVQPFTEGETRVLVCTDLASRGIHFDKVNHVVLFDFPYTILDYLHRVGRTGRVGSARSRCHASVFMTHRQDVRTAWQIKDAADKKEAILNQKMSRRLLQS